MNGKEKNERKCPIVVVPGLVGLAPRHADHLVVPINIIFISIKQKSLLIKMMDQNDGLCTMLWNLY